jgi:hypothetical protein
MKEDNAIEERGSRIEAVGALAVGSSLGFAHRRVPPGAHPDVEAQ